MVGAGQFLDVAEIAGLNRLWSQTIGEPDICVAVLDGPCDLSHPSLEAANLTVAHRIATATFGPASQHGTHTASLIFAQSDGQFRGIASGCRGVVIPIFAEAADGSLLPCSQIDLARAILQAIEHGAQIINVSAGEFSPTGEAHPILADAVQHAYDHGALIVAAAGNQGCECLQIPGALPSVLAVGAMNSLGEPLPFSNWGSAYQTAGILAPGEHILGANPGGGGVVVSGTSCATSIVSGVAALLLSLQSKLGQQPNPHVVRAALLQSALGCEHQTVSNCRQLLAGRLNVEGALDLIVHEGVVVSEQTKVEAHQEQHQVETEIDPQIETQRADIETASPTSGQVSEARVVAAAYEPTSATESVHDQTSTERIGESDYSISTAPAPNAQQTIYPNQLTESACSCACGQGNPVSLVYALGRLGYDFGTLARCDSICEHMQPPKPKDPNSRANPSDWGQLLAHLDKNSSDAASLIWTLNLDATPIYAVRPSGPYAAQAYERLCTFLREQTDPKELVERISVPGRVVGQVRLYSGQVVPVIQPELRGMYSWTTAALVDAVSRDGKTAKQKTEKKQKVSNFLERVYYEIRNLGMTGQERALNFAATNAFKIESCYEAAMKEDMDLDTIEVERSPVCRPDSDCWDVKLLFFYPDPERQVQTVRRVYRFTIDVSDVVPVQVGKVRTWYVR